ncbi:MAG: D-alanine--D-alanine ligase [Candidatus Omnitrophota bacterium]|nr:MAG: D-alanine--D-alanine ligase [Candidatus Omnitrophota bacterium]
MRVGVLGGGVSEEREISLISAQEVLNALKRKSIEAFFVDITTSDRQKVKEILLSHIFDVAFVALHGEFGEDGKIQRILQNLKIPHTGSSPSASYLSMDKIASKTIFVRGDIPTPPFHVCVDPSRLPRNLQFPLVVKPYFSGSSIGISIVRDESDLGPALKKAFSLQKRVLLEQYIEGREMTVGILEEKPLAVVEIVSKNEYFDFHTKYTVGEAELRAPAELETSVYGRVQAVALSAHRALGCKSFSRVDMRLSRDNTPFVLEVNSIPGLTSHSLLPLSAKCCGIDFDDLILKMTILAFNAKGQTQKV